MHSSDAIPHFERCGNTSFWRPEGQTNDDLTPVFVDPVSLVVIAAHAEPSGKLRIDRGSFREPYTGMFQAIHEELPSEESVPLNIWLRRVLEEGRSLPKEQIMRRFAELTPDGRRRIIAGIIHWVAKAPAGWKGKFRVVVPDLSELWTVLNSFGVHEC